MKAKIYISYKEGILDPQGNTVQKALKNLDFDKISSVKFGKYIEMDFANASKEEAEIQTEEACKKLLANHNTETFKFEVVDE